MGTWDIPILIVAGALLFIAGFGFGAGPGWGTRPPAIRVTNRGGHRTVVLGIEGFCRLVRGWEWVAPDDGDGTVGITLRGVGGTTGMQLALAQVDREIEKGALLPIAGDTVGLMLSINGGPTRAMRPIERSRPYTGTEGITIGQPGVPRQPRHDPTQPEPGAFDD